MSGVSILKICLKYPFSYMLKKLSTKKNKQRLGGKDKLIFKELLHFHIHDFQNHKGYFHTNKLTSYFERIVKKVHPEYFHWTLLKSWERFRRLKTYQEDIEHISHMTDVTVNKLAYIQWASSLSTESDIRVHEWIHPSVAVAFATWLHPLYGSSLSEQTNVKYDERYEETYVDAIYNFMEETKVANRHMDKLLQGE